MIQELVLSSVGQISDSIEYFEQRQQDASQKIKTMLAESENILHSKSIDALVSEKKLQGDLRRLSVEIVDVSNKEIALLRGRMSRKLFPTKNPTLTEVESIMKKMMSIAMSRSSDIDEMGSQLRNLGKLDVPQENIERQKNKYRLRKEKLRVMKKVLEERREGPMGVGGDRL